MGWGEAHSLSMPRFLKFSEASSPCCRMKLALYKMGEVSKKQQEHTRDVKLLQQKLAKIKEVSEAGTGTS